MSTHVDVTTLDFTTDGGPDCWFAATPDPVTGEPIREPEPGFQCVYGDIEGAGTGYNKTTVDIIAVPCIGADPIDTWARNASQAIGSVSR